jgi:hypothetical protein
VKIKNGLISGIVVIFGFCSAAAFADTNASTNDANTNTSTANSANSGLNNGNALTNNFISPSDSNVNEHVSGMTGSNTAVGLGSFSSSFSSDYCGGVAQAGVSAPYITIAAGHPVLGDPGIACVDTRASVHTMEYSATYGNAAGKALALADEAEKRNDKDAATAYRTSAEQYAAMSGKLADAAVNMLCKLSPDVRESYRDAGINCPLTADEKAAAAKEQVAHQAVAQSQPTDPLVRSRMGLPPLSVAAK